MHSGSARFSRRSFVSAALACPALGTAASQIATPDAASTPRPNPIALSEGLSITDIRAFPTTDVPRFLIELHSELDVAVDSIAIGTLLKRNIPVWATPLEPVLAPKTSTMLIGVLPNQVSVDQLATAQWEPCALPLIRQGEAERMESWDLTLDATRDVVKETHLRYRITVMNKSNRSTWGVYCQGLVWDRDQRLCGATATMNFSSMEPGTTRDTAINISPAVRVTASPFALVDRVDSAVATFTFQPTFSPARPGCPAAMPWNT